MRGAAAFAAPASSRTRRPTGLGPLPEVVRRIRGPSTTTRAGRSTGRPRRDRGGTQMVEPYDWEAVRGQFDRLSRDYVHLATSQFLTSHPRPVREAIEEHRRALDDNPVLYVEANELEVIGV